MLLVMIYLNSLNSNLLSKIIATINIANKFIRYFVFYRDECGTSVPSDEFICGIWTSLAKLWGEMLMQFEQFSWNTGLHNIKRSEAVMCIGCYSCESENAIQFSVDIYWTV